MRAIRQYSFPIGHEILAIYPRISNDYKFLHRICQSSTNSLSASAKEATISRGPAQDSLHVLVSRERSPRNLSSDQGCNESTPQDGTDRSSKQLTQDIYTKVWAGDLFTVSLWLWRLDQYWIRSFRSPWKRPRSRFWVLCQALRRTRNYKERKVYSGGSC